MLATGTTTRLQLELLGAVQLIVHLARIDVVERAGKQKVAVHGRCLHHLLLVVHDVVVVVLLLAAQAEVVLHIVQVHMVMMLFPAATQLLPEQSVRCFAALLLLRSQRRQRITTLGRLSQKTLQNLKERAAIN